MAKKNLECDIYETFQKFAQLSKKEMTSSMKGAIRAVAQELRKTTISNAKAGIKTTNNHPLDPYHGDEVWDAPRLGKFNDRAGEDLYVKVHIYGTKKADSQTYRFRFLDYVTKDRYARTYKGKPLQKPRYLGKIQGRKWFVNAQAQTAPQMERIFTERIDKCINKLNNTKV